MEVLKIKSFSVLGLTEIEKDDMDRAYVNFLGKMSVEMLLGHFGLLSGGNTVMI